MRITNSMIVSNFLHNLNGNLRRMDTLNQQIATQRRYPRLSDNPTSVVFSQTARTRLARLDHFQSGVRTAMDWLTQAEAGMMDMQERMQEVIERGAIAGATDVMKPEDRNNVAQLVRQLRDHTLDMMNTTFGGRFIFAGYNTPGHQQGSASGQLPFTLVPPPPAMGGMLHYNGFPLDNPDIVLDSILANDLKQVTIGPGLVMDVTVNGLDLIFFPDPTTTDGSMLNVFNVIDDLYRMLTNPDIYGVDEMSAHIEILQGAQNHLLTRVADVGGRVRRLELLEARYSADFLNYTDIKSRVEDIDLGEVAMRFRTAELVYQAALSSGARIIQPTLMDFLR